MLHHRPKLNISSMVTLKLIFLFIGTEFYLTWCIILIYPRFARTLGVIASFAVFNKTFVTFSLLQKDTIVGYITTYRKVSAVNSTDARFNRII